MITNETQIDIDGVTQDDSLCEFQYSILGPEFMFDFWIGVGYGWFVGGWEDYSPLGEEVCDYLLEWRIRYG